LSVLGGITAFQEAQLQLKLKQLDKEYEERRQFIENTVSDEGEKLTKLELLDKEFKAKAEQAEREAAKKNQKIAYAEAFISTAQAVANALATKPFIPTGLAAAVTAGLMGAAQIMKIKSMALAKGGIFDKPTFLPMMDGGVGQVAEAGEAEIVATPSNIRKAVFNGREREYGDSRPIVIENHIYLDGKEMKQFAVQAVNEASRTGRLKVDRKAVQ
jgi:hypothetical protein